MRIMSVGLVIEFFLICGGIENEAGIRFSYCGRKRFPSTLANPFVQLMLVAVISSLGVLHGG